MQVLYCVHYKSTKHCNSFACHCKFNGILHGDSMFLHELADLWVYFQFCHGRGLSPDWLVSGLQGSPFLFQVPFMLGRVASLFETDKAQSFPHVLCSFMWREIYPIHIHGIRVFGGSCSSDWLGQWNEGVPSSLELLESHHVPVEFSSLIKPLFPLPTHLFLSFG